MKVTNGSSARHPPRGCSARGAGDPDQGQGSGRRKCVAGRAALCVLAAVALSAAPAPAEDGATLVALEMAWQREINAMWHYRAYAHSAEREGLPGIAFLFQTIASAESIHAARHAVAIEALGGRMVPNRASVVVGCAADNLRRSVDLERWERDGVYPRFAEMAREEHLYEALAALNYAGTAEGTHAAMLSAALKRLEGEPLPPLIPLEPWHSESGSVTVYLCPGDGSVFDAPMVRRCPNCGSRAAGAIVLTGPDPGRRTLQASPTGPVAIR